MTSAFSWQISISLCSASFCIPRPNVTGDGSKVQCCKEQYRIGTWNIRSMNQGKLEAVKQEIAGITVKFGLGVQNKAGQRLTVLPRECTGHSKYPLSTTQEKTLHMDHHQMVNVKIRLIIFLSTEDGALYSQQKQDWELTGSDNELLIAKFRLKLKKVEKTTKPFRYDLNQIPYDYTVVVRGGLTNG